jgi:hypothetical protein
MLGMVAHVCNPSYSGGSGRRITVQVQLVQQYQEIVFEKLKEKD